MDVSRAVYGRELKIAAMRALDAGATNGEIARKYQVSPHLLERWRGEGRGQGRVGEAAVDQRRFPADAPEGHIEPRRCRPFSSRYRNAIAFGRAAADRERSGTMSVWRSMMQSSS
jgi:transposase-like protein